MTTFTNIEIYEQEIIENRANSVVVMILENGIESFDVAGENAGRIERKVAKVAKLRVRATTDTKAATYEEALDDLASMLVKYGFVDGTIYNQTTKVETKETKTVPNTKKINLWTGHVDGSCADEDIKMDKRYEKGHYELGGLRR